MGKKAPREFTVASLKREGIFYIMGLKPGPRVRFSYKAGQFVKIFLEKDSGEFEPFSIFSAPSEKELLFMFDVGSQIKSALSQKAKGAKVYLEGPYGDFTVSKSPGHSVLICKGLGLIPISSIGKALIEHKKNFNIYILYENLTRNEIVNEARLIEFDKHKQVNILMTLLNERPAEWPGKIGEISAPMVEEFVPSAKAKEFYVCGPPSFVNRILDLLKEMGVPESRIKSEAWG
ncbi:FAD-dependent oxidoreductase [Candidatus Micrarchaeota archaeon]|nr:FAD-dependent oxidoreductase [Candidatus Micrarchaeota archaeon]